MRATIALYAALDAAHTALRMVDASDTTAPQTDRTLDAVSAAVAEIERAARDAGHILPEFRRTTTNQPQEIAA